MQRINVKRSELQTVATREANARSLKQIQGRGHYSWSDGYEWIALVQPDRRSCNDAVVAVVVTDPKN